MLEPSVIVKAKPWWQSSTVWLGAVQIAVGAADLISKNVEVFGSDTASAAGTAAGILVVILRVFKTTLPISSSGAAEVPRPEPGVSI